MVNLTGSPVTSEVVDGLANPLTTTFSSGTIQLLGPTAANVSVSGRVLNSSGRQVYNAIVAVTDSNGNERHVRTNQFGRYRINGIPAGGEYVFTVRAKGYLPVTQIRTVSDDITGFDFQLDETALDTKEEEKLTYTVPRPSSPQKRAASP